MNIFLFSGGLGNQIFQIFEFMKNNDKYSHYSTILFNKRALSFLRKFYFETNEFKKSNLFFTRILYFLTKFNFFGIDSDVSYLNQTKSLSKKNIFTNGYFQKSFNNDELNYLKSILNNFSLIKSDESRPANHVLMHIRRADYVTINEDLKIDYYLNSIEYFIKNVSRPSFYVITNDKNWVQNHLSSEVNFQFLEINEAKLILNEMIKFRNIIMSNSTLSYWGLLLNNNENKKATVPTPWFRNRKNPEFVNDIVNFEKIKNNEK